tara:strand:+ start:268 stop:1317 length:1050 start_codon:yes stop_codon:yes gene_type:complete
MWIFILLALFQLTTSHVPAFEDDLLEQDIIGKSWGVYRELKKDESMLLRLNVPKGEELSFSVNLLGSATFVPGTEYATVTLYGHNTTQIACEPEFTGWSRRLDAGLDQLRVFPTDTADNGFHYEPFGIGFYRSLVACRGDTVVGDIFNLTITALEEIPVSIGVGMAESFGVVDYLVMSVSLVRTWMLDAWSPWWFLFTTIATVVLVYVLWWSVYASTNVNRYFRWEMILIHATLLFSVLQFSTRLNQLTMYGGPITDMLLSVTLLVHIIMPLIVVIFLHKICMRYELPCASKQKPRRRAIVYHVVMRLLLVAYSFCLLWQGYQAIPLVLFVMWSTYGCMQCCRRINCGV